MNLLPRIDERAMFFGNTGSGKTTMARWLLLRVQGHMRLCILDTKPDDALLLPGAIVIERAIDMPGVRDADTIVYRPVAEEMLDPRLLDAWLMSVYLRGDCLTHINEVTSVVSGPRPGPGLLNLLTRGRARNRDGRTVHSPLWMETQRPRGIPQHCYLQSQCFYMFDVLSDDDRKHIASFTTPDMRTNPRERYGFKYFHAGERHATEFGPLGIAPRRGSSGRERVTA